MRAALTVLFACVAITAGAQQPTAPACSDNGAYHERWATKNQPGPANVNAAAEPDIDVAEMLTWRVPIDIPADQRTSGKPITKEGHGHGPAGVVRTLWEIHPVVKVESGDR